MDPISMASMLNTLKSYLLYIMYKIVNDIGKYKLDFYKQIHTYVALYIMITG